MQEVIENPWAFWTEALGGGKPETTPGTPHAGFYIIKQYVSVPHGKKRVLVDFPVAIWRDDDGKWLCRTEDLKRTWTHYDVDVIDEIFARSCREPISHAKYQEMVATIEEYRK